MSGTRLAIAGLAALWLAGCASRPAPVAAPAPPATGDQGGGYYQNDGPPSNENIDISVIPNAVPRKEPLSKYGNPASYEVFGETYYTLRSSAGFSQTGIGSWYGRQFHGERTSSGEPYNMFKMTAAHKRLPIPSYVEVTNLDNGKQVIVRVNDRGPFHDGRIIDLSYVAARKLGIVRHGSAPVRVETITPDANASQEQDSASGPPLAAAADASRGLLLQVGAFGNRSNAAQLSARLQRLGLQRVSVTPRPGATTLYRVRVGPFGDVQSRNAAQRKLDAHGLPARQVR